MRAQRYIVLRRFYYKTSERAEAKKFRERQFHTGYVRKSPSGWSYVRTEEIS